MLRVKSWQTYQSYKDRTPPWIRLHRRLLDDYKFQKMSANARALLPMLWLLASEDEDPVSGMIRTGYDEIAFRLRMAEDAVRSGTEECVKSEFLEYVTDPLRICYETVPPETETETETESTPPNPPTLKIRSLGSLEDSDLNGHYQRWFEENCPQVDRMELREELVLYCKSRGKTYRDYWATLQTWGRRRQKELTNAATGGKTTKTERTEAALNSGLEELYERYEREATEGAAIDAPDPAEPRYLPHLR